MNAMPNTDPSTALLAAIAAAASTARILEGQLAAIRRSPEWVKLGRNIFAQAEQSAANARVFTETMEQRLTDAITPPMPVPDPRQPSTVEAMLAGMTKALEKSHTLDAIFAQEENR